MSYSKQNSCSSIACPPGLHHAFIQQDSEPYPSSLAVSQCHGSPMFQCSERQVLGESIQPRHRTGGRGLNTMGMSVDSGYCQVNDSNDRDCQTTYIGNNPLLMSAPRGQRIPLDRPNFTGEIDDGVMSFDAIYTPYTTRYGKGYTNYNTINGGQIQYYTIDALSDPYTTPNYVSPAHVEKQVVQDPMGVYRPEYPRTSLVPYNWDHATSESCDSFTHDTLEFRQELMERQRRKWNEQQYTSRWN